MKNIINFMQLIIENNYYFFLKILKIYINNNLLKKFKFSFFFHTVDRFVYVILY